MVFRVDKVGPKAQWTLGVSRDTSVATCSPKKRDISGPEPLAIVGLPRTSDLLQTHMSNDSNSVESSVPHVARGT